MPVFKPDITVLTPEPVIESGSIVQFPEGKPSKTILPVAVEQFG